MIVETLAHAGAWILEPIDLLAQTIHNKVWSSVRWFFGSLSNMQTGPIKFFSALNITDAVQADKDWELIQEAANFIEDGNGPNERVLHQASAVSRLAQKVFGWTPKTPSLAKVLQKQLDEGHCYGASMSVLKIMREHPDMNSKDLKTLINEEDITITQLLQDLRAYVGRQLNQRHKMQSIINSKETPDEVLFEAKATGVSDQIIREWQNDILYDRRKEARGLILKINRTIYDRMGVKELKRYKEVWLKESPEKGIKDIKGFLKDPTNQEVYIISCFPANDGVGHSMTMDLIHNRFFDENAGFYRYSSREKMVEAFVAHVKAFYPEYMNGEWDMRAYL